MSHDPVFKAKERFANRFMLCVVAFERSKQLIKGARARTERKHASPVTTALAEMAEGHVVPGGDAQPFRLA
jgi:DNA-directed RNA polymerase subunit K/omega